MKRREKTIVSGFTGGENAQTAKHEELKQSFQADPFVASTHAVASYQVDEEPSVV
jgi:hypothetical protein